MQQINTIFFYLTLIEAVVLPKEFSKKALVRQQEGVCSNQKMSQKYQNESLQPVLNGLWLFELFGFKDNNRAGVGNL